MTNDELIKIYQELEYRRKYRKIDFVFQDTSLYPKHLEFFNAGANYKERLFMAGNRVGKSYAGCCEVVWHLTGLYPKWWKGKRFESCNEWWCVSQSSEMSVKTLQRELLGNVGELGTGLIPKDLIDMDSCPTVTKMGVGISGLKIKHVSGGYSTLSFKSVEQGVTSFVGTTVSIFVDELLPDNIYQECITRITLGGNIMIHCFTPILGYTKQLQSFFGDAGYKTGEVSKHRYCVSATLWEAPHIPEDERQRLYNSWPANVREARSKGIPQLTEGAIFAYSEELISVQPFKIPDHYKIIAGCDVGWRFWAATWIAVDPDSGINYIYSTYKVGEKTPLQHWESIKSRGEWITIKIDPASHGRSQSDGAVIFDQMRDFGAKVENANNAREASLYKMQELFNAGQLKIFSTEVELIKELLNLERDSNGKIKEQSSKHLLDSTRYAVMGIDDAKAKQLSNKAHNRETFRRW